MAELDQLEVEVVYARADRQIAIRLRVPQGTTVATVIECSGVAREAPDPIGPEFRISFDEQNYGLELRTALENLSIRMPIQDVRIVTTAILIQKETGGNLAEVLDKCAQIIRERLKLFPKPDMGKMAREPEGTSSSEPNHHE